MNRYIKYWLIIFAVFLGIYVYTLAPDVVWQDQGDYQYRSAKCAIEFPGDVVRAHPLYIVLAHAAGRFTPMSYAYAANLVSALFAAIAVANVFMILYLVTGRFLPGVLAGGLYGFAHSVWFLAVQAQTYSTAMASLTMVYLLFVMYRRYPRSWYLLLAGLVAGLGMSDHIMSQIGFAVVFGCLVYLVIRGRLSWKIPAGLVVLWVVGAFLLWYVMWLEFERTGDMLATIGSAIWGKWGRQVFNIGRVFHLARQSFLFLVLNFPTPLVLFALPGIFFANRVIKDKLICWCMFISLVLYAIFAFRYDIPNQNHFFLPAYMLIAVYAGLGLAHIIKMDGVLMYIFVGVFLLLEIAAYPLISYTARSHNVSIGTRRVVPYRDEYNYYLIPWQQKQTGPRQLFTELFETLPPNAVLIVDSTVYDPLKYVTEAENPRPDITVFEVGVDSDTIGRYMDSGSRVYTICNHPRYIPHWIEPDLLTPVKLPGGGIIYELTAK